MSYNSMHVIHRDTEDKDNRCACNSCATIAKTATSAKTVAGEEKQK